MKVSKVAFVFALALTVLLAPGWAVSAQGGIGGTWNSGFQIQNIGENTASVTIEYYDEDGTCVLTDTVSIPAGSNVNVYPPGDYTDTELAPGKYSVVLISSEPIAAVANSVNIASQVGDSYLGSEAGNQQVYAPLIYRNYSSYTSIIYAQNATLSSQDITVALYRVGESTPAVSKTYSGVPRYATQEINLGSSDFSGFGSTYGSAIISGGSGDIAVVVVSNRQPGSNLAELVHLEYRGISASFAGKHFFAPLVFKNHNGWDSGVNLQNTESLTTTVTITYTASSLSSAYPLVKTGSMQLGPNAGGVFYLPRPDMNGLGENLPDGFFGGVELSSDTADILAIVNGVNYRGSSAVGSSYEALNPAVATDSIAGPLIFRGWADTETGINIQNAGNASTDVTLTISKAQGAPTEGGDGPWTFEITDIGPGEAATFYLPTLMPSISKLYGSATIASTDNVPIAAVINSPAYARGLSANYVGINY